MISLPLANPQGIIIYRGPSQINGKPIVAIATNLNRASKNEKTGALVQVYIMPDGIKPSRAVYNGEDESVCGDCPHRYVNGAGTCYVNPVQGPNGVFKGFNNGIYASVSLEEASNILEDKFVRLGSWGDPSAVPLQVWETILKKASGWTGYTHQWRRSFAKGLNRFCMASVETHKAAEFAKSKGWRTFRIRMDEKDILAKNEIECPASEEQGKRLSCSECGACNGGKVGKASVAIIAHGTKYKKNRLPKMIKLMYQKKRYRQPNTIADIRG